MLVLMRFTPFFLALVCIGWRARMHGADNVFIDVVGIYPQLARSERFIAHHRITGREERK